MILSDIGKVLWKALSAVVTATSNIAFCAGGLVVGIIGEILFGMLSIMFGILISLFSVMATKKGTHSLISPITPFSDFPQKWKIARYFI